MERIDYMKQFFTHPIFITTLKIIISIGLLWGVIHYLDVETIMNSFLNANPFYLFIGLSLSILQLFIYVYRWRYLLRLASKDISNEEVFTSYFVGFMAGFFTPSQVGEFAGRIASHPNLKKSHIVGITLVDKLYRTALTFIVGGFGLIIFIANYFPEYWSPILRYTSTFILGLITVVFLYPEKIKEFLKLLPEKIRMHRLYNVINILETEFHNKTAWILFSITLVLYLIILVEYYFLVIAFGEVSFVTALICSASVLFVKAVIFPISFGDLGVRESSSVFFFEKMGIDASIAFNAAIIMSFANVIVPTIIGAILVLRLKRKNT